MVKPHAVFLSNVITLPKHAVRPAIKITDERLDALGELYVRLHIGRRHQLDFDAYVWAVQTGRWSEYMEDKFPRIHYAPSSRSESSSVEWFVMLFFILVCLYFWLGGFK